MTKNIDFVDARPYNGYLIHAVRNQPAFFHRTTLHNMMTFHRALCGVGRGGMQIRLDKETNEPAPYTGVDGCDACHRKVNKIRKDK